MNQPKSEKGDRKNDPPRIILRTIICILILAGGFAAMKYFSSAKKHPQRVPKKEHAIEVKVKKQSVTVVINETNKGYLVTGKLPASLQSTYARIGIAATGTNSCKGIDGWLLKIN